MKKDVRLPSDYKPFKRLKICSNVLENGSVPVSISGDIPFLVGKGKVPRVWINMPSPKGSGKAKALLRDNLTLHPQIELIEEDNVVEVKVNRGTIMRVVKKSEEEAEITDLDLRSIGMAIHGDSEGLSIGPQRMSNNNFVNVDCMVGIDTDEKKL